MNNTKDERLIGIRLLRMCVLICCIISFVNTAEGLREYVFPKNPFFAYGFSLVFQSIIAVLAFRRKSILDTLGPVAVDHKKKTAHSRKGEKGTIKLRIAVYGVWFFALAVSIFFDFIYITNSSYSVTDNDDKMNLTTSNMIAVKNDLLPELMPLYQQEHEKIYADLASVYSDIGKVGETRYTKAWTDYWSGQIDGHSRTRPEVSVEDLAKDRIRRRNGASENVISDSDDRDRVQQYASYTSDAIVNEVIAAITYISPQYITNEDIDRLLEFITDKYEELQNIIETEQQYITILASYNNTDETNDEYNAEEELKEKLFQQSFSKPVKKANIDTIFSEQAIKQNSIHRLRISERDNLGESTPPDDATINKDNPDEWHSEKWKDAAWKAAVADEASELYLELSQSRILACQGACSDLDLYGVYLQAILSDPGYNMAMLCADVFSNKISNMSDIDLMCARINQANFSEETDNLDDRLEKFAAMKGDLANYIPLKNVVILLRNFDFVEEYEVEDDQKDKDKDNVGNAGEDSEDTPDLTNTPAPARTVKEFDKEKAKEQLDSLIINLSELSDDVLKKDANTDNATNQQEVEEAKSLINRSISTIMQFENKYINKKNPMITAVAHFSAVKDRIKNFLASFANNQTSENQKDSIQIPGQSASLVILDLLFAILVDSISIAVGYIVQKWE